jgi:hypothetical protein
MSARGFVARCSPQLMQRACTWLAAGVITGAGKQRYGALTNLVAFYVFGVSNTAQLASHNPAQLQPKHTPDQAMPPYICQSVSLYLALMCVCVCVCLPADTSRSGARVLVASGC